MQEDRNDWSSERKGNIFIRDKISYALRWFTKDLSG